MAEESESSSSSWSGDDEGQNDEKEVELTDEMIAKMQRDALNSEWLTGKPMSQWTCEQLQAWTTLGTLTELEKQTLRNDFDGSEILKCKDPAKLMKLLDISKSDAIELIEEIEFQDRMNKEKKYAVRFNKSGMKNKRNIDAMRWKSRPITKWTSEQTAEWIRSLRIQKKSDERDITEKIIAEELCGETITDCLESVSMLSELLDAKPSTASIIFYAAKQLLLKALSLKGADEDDEKKEDLHPLQTQYRNREIDIDKYKHIVLSEEPDIIMKIGPNEGVTTAKMPGCGHSIAAETLYFYIKTTFEKHLRATEIFCPDVKCKKLWDWSYCVAVADMNQKEIDFWNGERNQRLALLSFRKCPFCKKMCDKPDNLGILRIACDCGKGTFCWVCGKAWKSGSSRACGNKECSMVKETNEQLRNAELFTPMDIGKYNGQEIRIPELRACPVCMTVIYHEDQDDDTGHHCKHIKCPVCKDVNFCFVCLGLYKKGKGWPCGSYTSACPPAGIQEFK